MNEARSLVHRPPSNDWTASAQAVPAGISTRSIVWITPLLALMFRAPPAPASGPSASSRLVAKVDAAHLHRAAVGHGQ